MSSTVRWRTVISIPEAMVGGRLGALLNADVGRGIRVFQLDSSFPSAIRRKVEEVSGWSAYQRFRPENLAFVLEYDAERDLGEAQLDLTDYVERLCLAFWLVGPTRIYPDHVLHIVMGGSDWLLVQHLVHDPHVALPSDAPTTLDEQRIAHAKRLALAMATIERRSLLDLVQRISMLAIREATWEVRMGILWMAIESLLGSDDPGELTRTLAQRGSVLLETTAESRRARYRAIKSAYKQRSKVVHGRVNETDQEKLTAALSDSEALLRSVLLRVLEDPAMVSTFNSKGRDSWLDGLVLGGSAGRTT